MPVGLTPIYRITKGGQDITGNFNDRAVSIQVEIHSGNGTADTFSMTIDDRDFALARPQTGAQLIIELGYQEVGLAEQGVFEINEVFFEGPPRSLRIVGTSAGMRSSMKAPAVKEFENKTLGDVVSEIARISGAAPAIDPTLAGKKIDFLNQFNSNYHLLHELERRFGAVAKFEFGKLVFAKRDEGDTAGGNAMPNVIIRPEHILSYSVKHTDRSAYSSVKAAWWDKDKHQRVYEDVPNGALGQEMAQGQMQFPFIIGHMFNSKEEALEAAKSRVEALNRATGEATIALSKGDPWIRSQMPMHIIGMRDGVNGTYIIDNVTHSFTTQTGIQTTILGKPPGGGEDGFGDAYAQYSEMPLAGELLGQYGPMNHRQPGPV